MSEPDIRIYADSSELAREAARHFSALAEEHIARGGRFTAALSGGSTPRRMLELLASGPYAGQIPWPSLYFFWGDERMVAPDHPESNYRMARESLLDKVPVPEENIFRMRGEAEDPDLAAEEYSDELGKFFKLSGTELPRFDLVLLGMGADGHTASLFPKTAALHAGAKIAVANRVEKLNADRLTLTPATINNARNVTFLVAGEDKAPALSRVLEGPRDPETYPSQLIRPRDGRLLWLADSGAASLLKQP
ncbi:MAG TPA: 6-phosphogluconolactonase [Blastocatellia bacterium]|jgi:6-phosphogluconolactonase|nr:6-phosphogluconolactonase [Blastocatellia bacterium]